MAELTLAPLTASQHWRLPQPENDWAGFLADYLESLARNCIVAGARVIGHIKAIALFQDNAYLQVSVVSPSHPASIQGKVPTGCRELDLTLNVIVYGLEYEQLRQITLETAFHLAQRWHGEVNTQEYPSDSHSHPSTHHH